MAEENIKKTISEIAKEAFADVSGERMSVIRGVMEKEIQKGDFSDEEKEIMMKGLKTILDSKTGGGKEEEETPAEEAAAESAPAEKADDAFETEFDADDEETEIGDDDDDDDVCDSFRRGIDTGSGAGDTILGGVIAGGLIGCALACICCVADKIFD